MSDRKKKKKEMILDAALDLFLEKGYGNTKIIDIAAAAGIGKGTVYEYFVSKESILLELLTTKVILDYMRLNDVSLSGLSCSDKLRAYLKFQMEFTLKYGPSMNDFQTQIISGDTKLTVEIMTALHDIIRLQFECLYKIIEEGIESGEFKATNPYIATAYTMGVLGFYLSLEHQDMACGLPAFIDSALPDNKEDLLFDLLFNGLVA